MLRDSPSRGLPALRPSLRLPISFLACGALLGLAACRKPAERGESAPALTSASPPTPPKASAVVPDPPVDLVKLPESAYRAFLGFSGENLVLVSDSGIHFIAPGDPPRFHACPTGTNRALLGEDVIYYEDGRFFTQPARGGERRPFFVAPIAPKMTAAAAGVFLWVTAEAGGERLSMRSRDTSRVLYESRDSLLALALDGTRASFVESKTDGTWRLGLVDLAGGDARFGAFEKTRSPSSVVTAGATYFYDGPKHAVRSVTPSLAEPELFAKDLICSPLTTRGEQVFCAQVGGLFEVVRGRPPRKLPFETRGPIATLVANERHLAWIEDAGRMGFVARVFELAE